MTLAGFQQALCELIASPDLCRSFRSDGAEFLGRHELSPGERDRLLDVVWQRGMATCCTLYRSNRVTPIYTLLHHTCVVLGERLKDQLDQYWASTELRDLEFKQEIERFAHFLKRQVACGALADSFVEEVLDFEIALNDLRFAPRRQILREMSKASVDGVAGFQMHPLMRVVRFRHAPARVLQALAEGRVPRELAEEDAFLLLNHADDELSAIELEPEAGRLLWRLQTEGGHPAEALRLSEEDLTLLVKSGVLCTAPGPCPVLRSFPAVLL
jgi:hypothetical protein